jgi:hypothetical protein
MPAKQKAPEKLGFVPEVRSQHKQAKDKRKQAKAKSRVLRLVPRAPISTQDAATETLPLERYTLRLHYPSGRRKHLALHAEPVSTLENSNIRLVNNVLVRDAFLCLCCTRGFGEQLDLISHYLMHKPEELSKIGVCESEVLRYINEQYPRLVEEKPLKSGFELGKRPMS